MIKSTPTKFNTTGTPPHGRNHDHCSFQTPHVSVIASMLDQHPPVPKRYQVITTLQFSPNIDISFPDKRALTTAFKSGSRFLKLRPKRNKTHIRHSETPLFCVIQGHEIMPLSTHSVLDENINHMCDGECHHRPIPTRIADGCASVEISTVGRSIAKLSWSPSSLSAFETISGE